MTTAQQNAVDRLKRDLEMIEGAYESPGQKDSDVETILTAIEAAYREVTTIRESYKAVGESFNAAQQELVELRRDKERLDWLAEATLDQKGNGWFVAEFIAPVAYGNTLREALDAAIQKAT